MESDSEEFGKKTEKTNYEDYFGKSKIEKTSVDKTEDISSYVKKAEEKPMLKYKPRSRRLNLLPAILCCIPLVLELLAVLIIPHISALAENKYVGAWGWSGLSAPMRFSVISILVIGLLIQTAGLFGKLGCVTGMITQLVTFAIFVLSVYAANANPDSSFIQWGMAILVPVSLIVTALRYMSADRFRFFNNFNFAYYVPIAIEISEYALLFLVFPRMFGMSASVWMGVAYTVTTLGAIGVSSFWEDFRWAAAGINLAVAVLLCLLCLLGKAFKSEWMWNGGIILVVILAIGGSIFLHWFIHRNDV